MQSKNSRQPLIATPKQIKCYADHLREQEKSAATIQKYIHDLNVLCEYLSGEAITKPLLIGWKEYLTNNYAPATVNTMLAAMNSFLDFYGLKELKVKPLKIQKSLFSDGEKELSREEYIRLIRASQQSGNERLSLVIQTICSTGIRVSELRFITPRPYNAVRSKLAIKESAALYFCLKNCARS